MESSNPSNYGRERERNVNLGSEPARPSRSSRKRGLSAAPRVDALESRELLSSGVTRFLGSGSEAPIVFRPARSVHKTHVSAAVARAERHHAFPNATAAASATPQAAANISPQLGANPIPALGLTNNALVRRFFAGGQLGLTLQPPQIPANITTPTPVNPPVATTPVAPVTTTPAAPVVPASTEFTVFAPTSQTPPATGAPTPYPIPSPPYAPTPPNTLGSAVQTAYMKLGTDLQAIHDKSQVTPVMMAALRGDYQAIDKAATGPADSAKVATLQADIQAVGAALPSQVQLSQIKLDIASVIQSRGVTDSTLIDKTNTDAETIFNASNFSAGDATTLAADGKAINDALAAFNAANPAPVAVSAVAPAPGSPIVATPIAVVATPAPAMPSFGVGGMLNGLLAPLTGQTSIGSLADHSGPMPGGPNFWVPGPANFPTPNAQYTVMATPHLPTTTTTTTVVSASPTTPAQIGGITPA